MGTDDSEPKRQHALTGTLSLHKRCEEDKQPLSTVESPPQVN